MEQQEKKRVLEELGGLPEEIYDGLVTELIAQAAAMVSQMRQALAEGDYGKTAALAHTLKGTAANLRMKTIAEASRTLEAAAKDPAHAGIAEAVQLLEGAVAPGAG